MGSLSVKRERRSTSFIYLGEKTLERMERKVTDQNIVYGKGRKSRVENRAAAFGSMFQSTAGTFSGKPTLLMAWFEKEREEHSLKKGKQLVSQIWKGQTDQIRHVVEG